jgi:hypothetical protein
MPWSSVYGILPTVVSSPSTPGIRLEIDPTTGDSSVKTSPPSLFSVFLGGVVLLGLAGFGDSSLLLPTAGAQEIPAEQLLNPGFEIDGAPFMNPPAYWQKWAMSENPDGTLDASSWANVNTTPRTGEFCAGKVTDWGLPRHGFSQLVSVVEGGAYECGVWVRTPCQEDYHAGLVRLGVDPRGGDDPFSGSIIWTAYVSSATGWLRIGFTGDDAVVSENGWITLFLELWQPEYRPWNGMLFDDASVFGPVSPPSTPTVTPTRTPGPSPTPSPTPDHSFGMGGVWWGAVPWEDQREFNHRMLSRLREAGVTTSIWGIHWAVIEPVQGVYDWSRYDRELEYLNAYGIKPVGLIVTSPAWASFNGEAGNYPPGEHAVDAFMDFCAAAAERYSGRLYGFSFWNEPDIIFGWGTDPDPTTYAQWQKRYYIGIKRGDPDAMAATGGFLGRSLAFIEAIYRDVGGQYLDAVAIHPYPDLSGAQGQPYFDNDMITSYRSVMVANGDGDKPMWLTEFGWLMDEMSFDTYSYYLRRSYDYIFSFPYVTLSHLHIGFDWTRDPNGAHMGICDVNLHPRPPYWDYWEITRGMTPTPVPTPDSAAPNLLSNGDFEGGLFGWNIWHEDEFLPHGNVSVTAAAGRSGNGLRVEGDLFDSGVYAVIGGLDPESRYQLVGLSRCSELDAPLHFTMIGYDLTAQTAHGSASSIEYEFTAPVANTWAQYLGPPFSPGSATATIWLRGAVWRSLGRSTRADFDDLRLIEIQSPGVAGWQLY